MHPDLETETQTEQVPDLEIRILRGTPGINHVHPPAPTSFLSQAKLNFNLVVKCLQPGFRRALEFFGALTGILEIGSRVGRNQTTVMRKYDRWMQEGTKDRRGRSHPPQCSTSREDRQIVRMAVTDRSATSQTVAQHIESVTHHSVTARTTRRRLQQSGMSARRPLLGLPLTQNHRGLHRQWCDERRMWAAERNEAVFTDESRICLQHHDGRIRV
ncbi:transposable element Tcb1 transposase [Trichonephila clavipes]|nr:transposable element Tcb1 transposase [Trichonephila clavipes]